MTNVERKWKMPPDDGGGKSEKGYPGWLITVLKNRGLSTEQEISTYLDPSYENLVSSDVFKNIDKAVRRITRAISGNETIAVYGDYDVDGITATALIFDTLDKIGAQKIITYIPHREEEGYGLNADAIKELEGIGVKLVIAVDCGITSKDLIDGKNHKELDFIVCDHHEIEDSKLPTRSINVHPALTSGRLNLKGGSTSNKSHNLSACGMAFFLARALQKEFPTRMPEGQEKWLLDLVALATICDVVPLVGQNRLLAYFGLKVIEKTKRLGILELSRTATLNPGEINSYSVGFLLGPRLNAAGRLEHAREALNLLLTKDEAEAKSVAINLTRLNTERQEMCERILAEAKAEIESNGKKEHEIFLLSNKNWPRGVVGIIAGRIAEEYSRPVIVFEHDGEAHHGSARSVEGLDICEALGEVSNHLVKYGGHAKAAGVTVSSEKFIVFGEKLLEVVRGKIKKEDLKRELKIDAELKLEDINEETMEYLAKMEPFGVGNSMPVFLLKNIRIENAKLVGKEQNHLKFEIVSGNRQQATGGKPLEAGSLKLVAFSAIWFNFQATSNSQPGDRYLAAGSLKPDAVYDLVVNLRYNDWNNRKTIELRVIDMKESTA